MRHRAVLFDLDGTLIDSEKNYAVSDRRFLAEYGIELTEELQSQMIGIGSAEMLAWLRERHGITEPIETLLDRKNELYLELARRNTEVFPEMLSVLEELSRRNVPMAVASGSSRSVVIELLGRLGLDRFFGAVLSSEEVPRGKPHPDVFLETARRLGAEPSRCLVVEDSQHGVEAALGAGMEVVAVPTIVTDPVQESFTRATLLFPRGMSEFTAERFFSWLDGRCVPAP